MIVSGVSDIMQNNNSPTVFNARFSTEWCELSLARVLAEHIFLSFTNKFGSHNLDIF